MKLHYLAFTLLDKIIRVSFNSRTIYSVLKEFLLQDTHVNQYNHEIVIIEQDNTLVIFSDKGRENAIRVFLKHIHTSEDLLFLLKYCIQYFFPELNVIFVHSSSVIWKNKAFLFLGVSGSGKTTIARNSGLPVLSDDLTLVCGSRGKVFASGSLLDVSRKKRNYKIITNDTYPIHNMCVLIKSKENELSRLNPLSSFEKLLNSTIISEWKKGERKLLGKIPKNSGKNQSLLLKNIFYLSTSISCYQLHFRKDLVFHEIANKFCHYLNPEVLSG